MYEKDPDDENSTRVNDQVVFKHRRLRKKSKMNNNFDDDLKGFFCIKVIFLYNCLANVTAVHIDYKIYFKKCVSFFTTLVLFLTLKPGAL